MNLDHSVLDSTKINCYLECPRKFLFRHVAGWTMAVEKYDLLFGKAWHKAVEFLVEHGATPSNVKPAYMLFEEELGDSLVDHPTKNKAEVLNALVGYVEQYGNEKVEPLHIEVGGTMLISHNKTLYFKIDSIVSDYSIGKLIVGIEFKTGSRNSEQWRMHWKNSFQTLCYLHALNALYGEEKVWGLKVRGAIFTKTKGYEFVDVPVRASIQRLELWLEIANQLWDKINSEIEALKVAMNTDEPILDCFLPNFCCNSFGGCVYFDYCISEPNPLRYFLSGYVPPEMKVEFWSPLEQEVRERVNLEGGI